MDWARMSTRQKDAARKLVSGKLADVEDATVSQVAKYFDDVMDFDRGAITLAELCRITGWTPPAE